MQADKKRFFPTNFPTLWQKIAGRAQYSAQLLLGNCCVVCAQDTTWLAEQSPLCQQCLQQLQRELPNPDDVCTNCGVMMTGESLVGRCRACVAKPPAYQYLHAIGQYDGILADLITRAKIAKQVGAVVALLSLTRHYSEALSAYPDYTLLAMPTPRWRLLQRGFNLPELLAKALAQQHYLPQVSNTAVTLPWYVAKQAKLTRHQRQKNRHLYQINHKLPKKIIIIDDIVTTGATVGELAQVLCQNGVESVAVWAISRAQLQ